MKSSATKPRARPVGGLPVDVQYTPAATMRKPPPITTPCTGETSTFSAHTGRPARATRVPARAAAGSTKALHVAQRASNHSDDARICSWRLATYFLMEFLLCTGDEIMMKRSFYIEILCKIYRATTPTHHRTLLVASRGGRIGNRDYMFRDVRKALTPDHALDKKGVVTEKVPQALPTLSNWYSSSRAHPTKCVRATSLYPRRLTIFLYAISAAVSSS